MYVREINEQENLMTQKGCVLSLETSMLIEKYRVCNMKYRVYCMKYNMRYRVYYMKYNMKHRMYYIKYRIYKYMTIEYIT